MAATLKPLAEQVIVVTGASSGIGLVTARMAARRGAAVFLIARNGEALVDIVRRIEEAGGRADFAVADVADTAQMEAAADAAVARYGRIDTWVNNAGVAIYAPLLDTPDDEHRRMFETNYFGMINGSRAGVARMRRQGGALITVASVASDMPSPIMGAYAATKHAVKAWTESLRIELGAADVPVHVTLVKPSGISTPIGDHSANHLPGAAKIPPPAYTPELVAEAILDCAEHPRREITVGGAGRAQVLFAAHFPAAFERLAQFIPPLLQDRSKARAVIDNLSSAGTGGRERSRVDGAIGFSPYTSAKLHPLATGVGLAMGAAAMGLWVAGKAARRTARLATGR